MSQSEALSKVDDLRVCIIDLEADNLENVNELKALKSSSPQKRGRASKVTITGNLSNLSKASAESIIEMFYEDGALSDNVKIGKHPKTTGVEKEGLAKFLTRLYEVAGMTGEFKAFNSAIIIPS